jgi:hypothetical protein
MRRIIDLLSIVGLVTAPVAIGLAYSQSYAPQAVAEVKEALSANFPLNKPQFVNFQTADEGFKRLSDRQQQDQLRDWLLFTVISGSGLSTPALNQSTYDLPTVRYGYLSPVSNFEYGEARSLYVGNGQVIALIPKSASQVERDNDLTHIVDRHRKDLGKLPTSVSVFDYEISSDRRSGSLLRHEVLDAKALFSPTYGYHEAQIQSLSDLQNLMKQIDDITFAQVNGSTLTLGGRKIASSSYQGIRVEDIAALWQSDTKQQQGSGFSLDPKYDYAALAEKLAIAEPTLRDLWMGNQSAASDSDLKRIKQSLAQQNPVPYLELIDRLNKAPQLRSGGVGSEQAFREFLNAPETTGFQAARYDGNLQGTEVGMVLFYTDLLAKLWALNYVDTAPSKAISNFDPLTKLQISSIYKQEIEELPSTRLWFGSQDRGFQVANRGDTLLLARNATRIYAASSNPLKPGAEMAAAANTSSFLSWWNDHYEEVARYEPQYERLNQIMKWSMVINWLNQADRGEQLSFLQGVEVKRNAWFPDWVKQQSDRLKFRQWDQVIKGVKTEAMPLLFSSTFQQFGEPGHFYAGGVSLADVNLFRGRRPLPATSEIGDLGLQSNLNYGSVVVNEGKLTFNTLDETAYSLKNLDPNLSVTTAQAQAGARFRSPDAELANQAVHRSVSQIGSDLQIDTKIGDTELGTFSTIKAGNGFTTGFLGRDIDAGYALGLRLSRDLRPIETVLKESADVEVVLKSGTQPEDYFVKMTDSEQWMKLTQESGGGGSQPPKPPKNWQFRVGDFGDESRNFRLSWDNDDTVKRMLAKGEVESVWDATSSKQFTADAVFADDVQNLRYREISQKLVDDLSGFFAAKKLYFKAQSNRIDRLIKTGNDMKAALYIDNLIKFYGPDPSLMLRKAIVEIRQGRLQVKSVGLTNGLPGRGNFFDEITSILGRKTFSRIETDKAFYYVQDNPGLNNIDWNASPESSMPTGSGVRVYQLLPGDIGDVKLHLSGLGDTSTSLHASTQFRGSNIGNSLRNVPANQSDRCNPDRQANPDCPVEEQSSTEKPVYVVIMSEEG